MPKDEAVSKILINEKQIIKKCKELGTIISKDYENKNPILICTLKGAVMFYVELVKHITIPFQMEFMKASSYVDSTTTEQVNITSIANFEIKDRDILIVEDIVDTGLTLNKLCTYFKENKAKSVKIVALINKNARRKVEINPDYLGFDIENHFVIGYGLDYNEKFRNLNYIGIIDPNYLKK